MEFFAAIKYFQKKFSKQGVTAMLVEILKDKRVQQFIIDMNQEQLYEYGEDSKGRLLGEYSDGWKIIREEKGLRVDHVTLYFDGIFYKSFFISVSEDGFTQDADPERGDVNLYQRFGVDIIGLNEDNIERLKWRLVEEMRFRILKNAA
jgi:hypothetical protein